jgi:hypothetical protein
MTGEYSVRELLLLAQNHIPPSQITLRDAIEGWLASHPASSDLRAQNADAYGYAKRFLEAFVAENFPPNPDWKPLPDLMGVLTQIDNASTIASDLRAQNAELVAALKESLALNENFVGVSEDETLAHLSEHKAVIAQARAALAAAGHP